MIDAIDELVQDGNAEKRAKWLYDVLSIIDNKTAHLLRLNSMLLTAQIFLFGIIRIAAPSTLLHIPLLLLLFVPLVGVIFSLSVFRIAWPFLSWKIDLPGLPDTLGAECTELACACVDRTISQEQVRLVTIAAVCSLATSLLIGSYLIARSLG